MKLDLERISDNGARTIGVLRVDGEFCCWTLEDARPGSSGAGKGCIPFGDYDIDQRTIGRWAERFAARWPWHGHRSLEICDVPGFSAVLIHPGNSAADTRGCVLPGLGVAPPNRITHSRLAYCRIARHVLPALQEGVAVTLHVSGFARGPLDLRMDEEGPK